MPIAHCEHCGSELFWSWTEAFDKFGFNDGDGNVDTSQVEAVLAKAGYAVTVDGWGLHNTVITSIKKNNVELIPHDVPGITFGYDNPRSYLPKEVVDLLDEVLPVVT